MHKQTIALHLRKYNYTGLQVFAQGIHDQVQNNALLYPSPSPSLLIFQASIDTIKQRITDAGGKGNRGGTTAQIALLAARTVLRGYVRDYARYVMVAQPDNYGSWTELGFVLKKLPSKTGRMQPVQYFSQFHARNIPQGKIKLRWRRPPGTPQATMITYILWRSPDENFTNAAIVGYTMNKATYIDTPPKGGVLYTYWVVPVTTAGDGVISEMCTAFASPV